MNKEEYKETIQRIEEHMKAVAEERDKLDEFIDELEGLKWSCESAYEDLQRARNALSELV